MAVRWVRRVVWIVVLGAVSIFGLACAKRTTGDVLSTGMPGNSVIYGRCFDEDFGEALAGAKVTLTSISKGVNWTITTDGSGHYRFFQLPPARDYYLEFKADGFITFRTCSMYLLPSTAMRFDSSLCQGCTRDYVCWQPPGIDYTSTSH